MGSQVKATCQCGLNKNILVGGGMMNFNAVCYFPCYCEICKDIVQSNLIKDIPQCPKCKKEGVVPYDNDSLIHKKGKDIVIRWNMDEDFDKELQLTDGEYFCPKCTKMKLRFELGYLTWD